ncbi:MAG: hypothetical protein QG552_3424, partial [Thermodesulfobacteriota bacterium]|nr:hypothetical protein [Thermodesulfobacteriota bacterium]
MKHVIENDLRLIEAGFPCHQVGAETRRERGLAALDKTRHHGASGHP